MQMKKKTELKALMNLQFSKGFQTLTHRVISERRRKESLFHQQKTHPIILMWP